MLHEGYVSKEMAATILVEFESLVKALLKLSEENKVRHFLFYNFLLFK